MIAPLGVGRTMAGGQGSVQTGGDPGLGVNDLGTLLIVSALFLYVCGGTRAMTHYEELRRGKEGQELGCSYSQAAHRI